MCSSDLMMVVVLTVSSDICDLNLCLTLALTHLTGRDLIVSLASTVKKPPVTLTSTFSTMALHHFYQSKADDKWLQMVRVIALYVFT